MRRHRFDPVTHFCIGCGVSKMVLYNFRAPRLCSRRLANRYRTRLRVLRRTDSVRYLGRADRSEQLPW